MSQAAVETATQVCRVCEQEKRLDDFGRLPNGRRRVCKACRQEQERIAHLRNPEPHRWRMIRHRYGIEKSDYDALLVAQGGVCAICRNPNSQTRAGVGERYPLHIDHDHDTGEIRGLLCSRCNNGIGLLSEIESLRAAIEYLEGRRTP